MAQLFLNLASHIGHIAYVSDSKVLAIEETDHRISDAELPSRIEAVLKKAKMRFKDLTGVACVLGPGGFTSLRVAVSSANAIAYALKIPSAGVHESDLYRARAKEPVVWVHSTKKDQLFVRFFPGENEPSLLSLTDLSTVLTSNSLWMGELIPEQRVVADQLGAKPAKLLSIEEVLPKFLETQKFSSQVLLPWYGRGL